MNYQQSIYLIILIASSSLSIVICIRMLSSLPKTNIFRKKPIYQTIFLLTLNSLFIGTYLLIIASICLNNYEIIKGNSFLFVFLIYYFVNSANMCTLIIGFFLYREIILFQNLFTDYFLFKSKIYWCFYLLFPGTLAFV